jgi:HK97 family phage portal protein
MKLSQLPASLLRALRIREPLPIPGASSYMTMVWPDNAFQLGSAPPGYNFALSNSAVFAAIDRISSDIAKIPLRHWKRRADGGRDEIVNSQIVQVWRKPNPHQTQFDVIKALVASQLYRGNGYIYATLNGRNQVVEMYPLASEKCIPYVYASEVFYRLAVDQLADIQVSEMVPARYILHHRMLTYGSGILGISPLVAAAASISTGNNIQNYGASFFGNAARPSGYLTTANKLDRQKAEEIGKRWRDNYAGSSNAGKTAVLEQGLEYKQVVLTAVDSQMVEQLKYTTDDVARVFQLPGPLIGDISALAARGVESLMRVYYSLCLGAHFESLQARINAFFELDTTKEFVEFDTDELFKTDLDIRTTSWAKAVQGGLATPNEGRAAAFYFNPVEGGDQVFMQQQMIPLTMLGHVSLPPGVAPPPGTPSPDEVKSALAAEARRRLARWAA